MTHSPTSPSTRISPIRVAVLAAVSVVSLGLIVGLFRPILTSEAVPGRTGFAGYVDVTATPSYPFETPVGAAQRDVILAFIVGAKSDACKPSWGGYYSLNEAAESLQLDRRIAQLRLVAGEIRVSFGGQANSELAENCTDVQKLRAAYSTVVQRYNLQSIDLDLEGAALREGEAMQRRISALQQVQTSRAADAKPLDIWLTLPVDRGGLTSTGAEVLRGFLRGGVSVSGVNGMAMDFGASRDLSQPVSAAVVAAARSLHEQLQSVFRAEGVALSSQQAWSRAGITVMIGQNDNAGEVFGIADATRVNRFARQNGLGLLSMWSANRDRTCPRPLPAVLTVVRDDCSGVDQGGATFADLLGGRTTGAGIRRAEGNEQSLRTKSPAPVTADDPATSPFPIWDPLGTYSAGAKVVWKHNVYMAKWWTSGVDPTMPVSQDSEMPWTLLGPVMPGDKPAPLPKLPSGTYPTWTLTGKYAAGARVQVDGVPYQAKWWNQGLRPGKSVAGGSPWSLIYPSPS